VVKFLCLTGRRSIMVSSIRKKG